MVFFKKKKLTPQIYFALDIAKEEAAMNDRKYFYHPLSPEELTAANNWAFKNDMIVSLSHNNGETLIYKFYQQEKKND